jgi:hypothetical protein
VITNLSNSNILKQKLTHIHERIEYPYLCNTPHPHSNMLPEFTGQYPSKFSKYNMRLSMMEDSHYPYEYQSFGFNGLITSVAFSIDVETALLVVNDVSILLGTNIPAGVRVSMGMNHGTPVPLMQFDPDVRLKAVAHCDSPRMTVIIADILAIACPRSDLMELWDKSYTYHVGFKQTKIVNHNGILFL